MKLGQTLIDKASKVCGSDAELARRIGVYPPDISNLRAGKRELSPEMAALIADVAGLDPQQAVIDAVIERNKTGQKAEQIRQILGKATAAGAAAMLLFFYGAPLFSAMGIEAPELTVLYIVLCALRAVLTRCVGGAACSLKSKGQGLRRRTHPVPSLRSGLRLPCGPLTFNRSCCV